MKNKEFSKNIYEFCLDKLDSSKKKTKIFFILFVLIGLISLFSTFFLSILSTLKLGKLWIFNISDESNIEWQNTLINNYVYVTTIINSIVSLLGYISTFFAFKEGYLKNKEIAKKINFELIQYKNKIGYYFKKNEKDSNDILLNHAYRILNLSNPFEDESEEINE